MRRRRSSHLQSDAEAVQQRLRQMADLHDKRSGRGAAEAAADPTRIEQSSSDLP